MKSQTNVEFITHLMEYSRNGALMQAFVVEALAHYASEVKDAELPGDGVINPEAWKRCAAEALAEINAKYGAPVA